MKKKRATAERYVRLTHGMMQSQAWQSLDGNARAIYIELAMLYRRAPTTARSVSRHGRRLGPYRFRRPLPPAR